MEISINIVTKQLDSLCIKICLGFIVGIFIHDIKGNHVQSLILRNNFQEPFKHTNENV